MSAAIVRLWPYLLVLVLGAGASWHVRGLVAESDAAKVAAAHSKEQQRLEARVAEVEATNKKNTQESTKRVDAVEEKREAEVVYVNQEVVRYVTKYRDSACHFNSDWVCSYNRALGLPCNLP